MEVVGEPVAVLHLDDFEAAGVPVTCSSTQEIGTFSLVGPDRKYEDGSGQLKFLHLPSKRTGLALDLNSGYDRAIRRTTTDGGSMEYLVRWVANHKDALELNDTGVGRQQRKRVDFVVRRGALIKMATAPYEQKEDWVFGATRHDGVIYMTRCGTVSNGLNDTNDLHATFRGHKFEQYLTTSELGMPPDTDAPVNEREAICVVTRRKIGEHTLIISSEVDACDHRGRRPGLPTPYVEIKTRRMFTRPQDERNFRR